MTTDSTVVHTTFSSGGAAVGPHVAAWRGRRRSLRVSLVNVAAPNPGNRSNRAVSDRG